MFLTVRIFVQTHRWWVLATSLLFFWLIYSRIYWNFFSIQFDEDPITYTTNFWMILHGHVVSYGPTAFYKNNYGNFAITSAYYYLGAMANWVVPSLKSTSLLNGIFSFFSVGLFGYLVYSTLSNIEIKWKLWLSWLAAMWYALLYYDVWLANMIWNPSPINCFFFIVCICLYKIFHIRTDHLLWHIALAVATSILFGLHSTMILVFFPVFISYSILYSIDVKKYINVLVSLITLIIGNSPYLWGELHTHATNTKIFLKTVFFAGSGNSSDKINDFFLNLFGSLEKIIFADFTGKIILFIGVGVLIWYGLPLLWKSNKMGKIILGILSLFSLSTFFYDGFVHVHYFILYFCLIPLLVVHIFSHWKEVKLPFVPIIAIVIMIVSMGSNASALISYNSAKVGYTRVKNTDDLYSLQSVFPEGATVCWETIKPTIASFFYPSIQIIPDLTNSSCTYAVTENSVIPKLHTPIVFRPEQAKYPMFTTKVFENEALIVYKK